MPEGNDAEQNTLRLDVSRMRPVDASKMVASRIWRTREGQRVEIRSDREVNFLLPVLAENGFTYERPQEEDGVHTVRAVRK